MSRVIKARGKFADGFSVFLAGSVAGDDWRKALMSDLQGHDILFLDPRSDDYSDLEQSASDPNFREQVEWEENGLEKANVIALYFDRKSTASISLLEFGLFARSGKLIVFCADGYRHKGYVDVLCKRFGIEQVNTLDELSSGILSRYSK